MTESQSGSVRPAEGGPTQSEAAAARSLSDVVFVTARMRVLVTQGTDLGVVTDQLHRVLEGTEVTLVDDGPAEAVDDGPRKPDVRILVEYVELDCQDDEADGDSLLWAASPDLLAVAKSLVEDRESCGIDESDPDDPMVRILRAARSAIAKAGGGEA